MYWSDLLNMQSIRPLFLSLSLYLSAALSLLLYSSLFSYMSSYLTKLVLICFKAISTLYLDGFRGLSIPWICLNNLK